jgi:hypothetical protein
MIIKNIQASFNKPELMRDTFDQILVSMLMSLEYFTTTK